MFLHLSVSHSVHGGRCTPSWADNPSLTEPPPRADTPPGQTLPLGQIPPQADTPGQTPHQTATAADGKHPTGIHSYYLRGA